MKYAIVNGIKIFLPKTREELIEYAFDKKKILIAINAEKIHNSSNELKEIIYNNIGYSDGVGSVLALKNMGINHVFKIPGCELWLDIIEKYKENKSFYFVGGKENVINKTIKKIKNNFPEINILGYRNGFFSSENQIEQLIIEIKEKSPDIIFVAIGSPMQELVMQRMKNKHNALYQGLGGSFDVYIDLIKRAPKIWINLNLEWAYRLIKQPKRIKRQIYLYDFFIRHFFLFLQRLFKKK